MTKILTALDKAFDRSLTATSQLGIVLLLLMSVFVFGVSFGRYVLRINMPGMFDSAVYTLIAFPFLTMAYTLKEGGHICIDIVTSRLAERGATLLRIASYLVSSIYVIILGWQGVRWALVLFRQGVMTEAAFRIPKGVLVSVMVFGCFLLFLQIIRKLVHDIRSVRSYKVPGQTSSPRLKDNPWLAVSLFIIGVIAGILLSIYVNPIAGISFLALVVLFSGMPVFLALGLLGCLGIYFLLGSASLQQLPITAYKLLNSFPLTCLPLFILGGLIMEESGLAEDVFRFFQLWLGRYRIAPLLVTIIVGMVFCAISGSSIATTAIVAAVAMPILTKRGYDKSLACGVVAGATVGTLIPPSIGYVVYGVITGESVGGLFMATLVPAMVLFAFYYLYVIIRGIVSRKSLFENGQEPSRVSGEHVTWKDRLIGLKTAVWAMLTPLLIIGGIYFGVYTPTESAAVLVVYAIIVAVLVKRATWQEIIRGTLRSAMASSMILCIIFSAYILALIASQLRLAASLVAYAEATGMTALPVLGILFAILIVLGLFLDGASAKVITLPIFYPLAMAVGINGLWLGVFYQFLAEIGLLTPPVGLNVFVMKGVSPEIPLGRIFRGCVPFVLMMILTVILMYLFPQLVTWLPSTMRPAP